MRRLNIVGWVTILTLWVGGPFCALPVSQQYSLAPMLNTVTPAVVNISTEGSVELRLNPLFNDPFFRRFFNVPERSLQKRTQSLGSGVIVDSKKGLILTNYHVIKSADEIRVKLLD
ncbi:MAG: serine endoprotease DegQ, partial [Pseudomonadota bacterium]|nr:serine endoprotease DegQ [Pseudomonadota bacterium]